MVMATEHAVMLWYSNNWNGTHLFSKKPWDIDINTSLNTGNHPWLIETGEEIMADYFKQFSVDDTNFNILTYWPVEPGWIPNFLLPRSLRVKYIEPTPLTLRMMARAVDLGFWAEN